MQYLVCKFTPLRMYPYYLCKWDNTPKMYRRLDKDTQERLLIWALLCKRYGVPKDIFLMVNLDIGRWMVRPHRVNRRVVVRTKRNGLPMAIFICCAVIVISVYIIGRVSGLVGVAA